MPQSKKPTPPKSTSHKRATLKKPARKTERKDDHGQGARLRHRRCRPQDGRAGVTFEGYPRERGSRQGTAHGQAAEVGGPKPLA